MGNVVQDIRFAFRTLMRTPAFTLVAIGALAVGIGANTAIFTVMQSALMQTLRLPEPDRLMSISMTKQNVFGDMEASYPNYLDWRSQAQSFSGLTGYGRSGALMRGTSGAERLDTVTVPGDFFRVLGFKPATGRVFYDGEEKSGAKTIVITHALWERALGGDPTVVGKTLSLDGEGFTVVGVLPRSFQFAPVGGSELFKLIPTEGSVVTRRNLHWFNVVGRLKPGVSREQAMAEMSTISSRLAQQYPESNGSTGIRIVPLAERIVGEVRPILMVLMAAVGFVLLIACVNVANLLLTRAVTRQREIAIRNALGAGRFRIVQQLLTESLVLSALGGAAGVLFGAWVLDLLISSIPAQVLRDMPYISSARLGALPLAFTAGVSLLSGLLFGLAPAWRSSAHAPFESLKESGGWGSSRRRIGFALVSMEVALSVILLVGAGLMIKSLVRMFDANPGFNTQNLLTARVFFPPDKYEKDEPNIQLERAIRAELKKLPGVVDVGSTSRLALGGGGTTARVQGEGQPIRAAGEEPEGNIRSVSESYFSTLGATLLKGRYFDERDSLTSPQVVIINRSMAQLLFGTTDVVGKRVRFTYKPDEKYREIVGVINDVKESSLDGQDKPATYTPYPQDTAFGVSYVLRTAGDPETLTSAAQESIQRIEPSAAVFNVRSMEDLIDESYPTFLRRYPATLISGFGGVALALAMLGLYGIISYSVSQRTREIGIRMALGAQRGDVLRMFVREGLRVTIGGLLIGIPTALVAAQLMAGLLFGVKPMDAQVMLIAPICLAAMALAAVTLPAYRATRVDPNIALRYE